MDLFSLISTPNPAKVKTGTRPRATHEVPLLTATANRVIDMEDSVRASESSGTPSTLEKNPSAEDVITAEVVPEPSLEKEVAAMGPFVNKRHRKRGKEETEANASTKVLRKDHDTFCPVQGTIGGESPVPMGLDTGSTIFMTATQDALTSVSDPDPLSYAKPQPHHERDIAQSSGRARAEIPTGNVATTKVGSLFSAGTGVGRNQQLPPGYPGGMPRHGRPHSIAEVTMCSQLRLRFEQEVRLLKKATAKIASRDQKIQARKEEIKRLDQDIKSLRDVKVESDGLCNQTKNLETLLEAGVYMKKVVEASNTELAKELKSINEKMKAAFKEVKRYEDDKVEQRYAKMDARIDKLSVDFDEELYPHMLAVIAGRRWVIGHDLCLAVMKCAESLELRQSFTDVVSAGLAKGMSEGLKHGIEHMRAGRDLSNIEAYDSKADSKYVKALHDLKDLKYPPWIHELHPSLSQLKIPVYHEVRDPKDLWYFKEEMLLEDAIVANISCTEKKKKCRVVCHTHEAGFAHHARSNGVPVSVPTVAPQGLAILLADAATQTEISEDEASPRLLRSKSLPPMYNLDWP
nr:hypothetical protein [Tanacetum cinerariifolium]